MKGKAQPLHTGDEVPDFSTRDESGNLISKSSLLGTSYLIYFYPRDNTPGCTAQACGFRDLIQDYRALEVLVLGVSGDTPASHIKFIKKNKLPYPLLMDEDHQIALSFGVYGEKKFMGRTFDGIHRSSFLVGPDGKIIKAYHKVKAKLNPDEVLADLIRIREEARQ